MVCSLVVQDRDNCAARIRIVPAQVAQLCREVSQHDCFHGNRGSRDGPATTQAGQEPQKQTSRPAKMIAPASAPTSTLELAGEYVPVTRFVLLKFFQSRQQAGITPTTGEALAAVDVDRPVFASVIYLKYPVTESLSQSQACRGFHRPSSSVLAVQYPTA
jgi:hypothetical protein